MDDWAMRLTDGIGEAAVSEVNGGAAGLYCLAHGSPQGAGKDNLLSVTTPSEQWGYALVVPPQLSGMSPGRRFQVKLAVRVLSGRVGAGVTTKDGSRFHHFQMTSPDQADGWQFLELRTPPAAACGSLVINNAFPRGSSRVELRILEITELSPLGRLAAPAPLRQVHVIEDVVSGTLQDLYLDRTTNWLRSNLTLINRDGSIFFETNELGVKGDPVDPNRRLAMVWGDSVVFGIGRGWPCLLDDMLPGYQFLNGGIEGDEFDSVLYRAITLNHELDVALNIIMLGWHPIGYNANVRADLGTALDGINNPVLVTMPTALNSRMIKDDISHLFIRTFDEDRFYFCGAEEYSVETQQKVFQHILERNQISREVAAAKGVPLLDLFAALDTERLADFRQDFFDVLHPRPAAYQKIAAAIYEGMGIMPPANP